MKYFTFMATDSGAQPNLPEEDNPEEDTTVEWVKQQVAAGTLIDGGRIEPRENAKTVRVRNGELIVTDGPFTESKEWISGWAVMECDDREKVIEIMAKHPVARHGQIEIRPFWDGDDQEHSRSIDDDPVNGHYIMFVCVDPNPDTDTAPEPDVDDWFHRHNASGKRVTGHVLTGTGDAITVTVRDGTTLVHDGPFTASKEWIAGYDLLNCTSMDEAVAIAAEHAMARSGRIEVRAAMPSDSTVQHNVRR